MFLNSHYNCSIISTPRLTNLLTKRFSICTNLTFELSRQGSVQTGSCPCLIRSQWGEGEQQGQTSVSHADIKAGGEQLVSVCDELSLGLKLSKDPLNGDQALREEKPLESCLCFDGLSQMSIQ